MKKFTFILIMMLGFLGFTMAQTIENFETSIQMNLMEAGPNGSLTVVPNPDTAGNHSVNVVKFVRGKGQPWGGFWGVVTTKVDLTTNKFVHVKVWKPRISPVKIKIEKGSGATLEIASMYPQTDTNKWQELVFNFSSISGTYDGFNLMPDFQDPLVLTGDITIYFDDLTVNNDSTIGSPALQVVDDFESIPLNRMNDQGTFTLIPNPYQTGINLSAYVLDFLRLKDAVSWTGFWSKITDSVDVTTNKYVHVKLWKPRLSVVKFKLEGGTAGTLEIPSMNAQTKTDAWEDFVFDFSSKTGSYPIIALIPDNRDSLAADNHIYIDDIIVNNDSTPAAPTTRIVNVDMRGFLDSIGQRIFLSGNLNMNYGNWATPGDKPACEMFDANGDSIYSIELVVPDGNYEIKFFKGTGWSKEDPAGNRKLAIVGNLNITYKWGVKAANLTLNVDMHGSGLTVGQPVYFAGNFGGDYGSWNEPGTNMMNKLTDADGDSIYTAVLHLGVIGTYDFKFFAGPTWAGGEWAGDPNRTLVVAGDMTANYIWGSLGQVAVRQNPLAGKILMYPNPVRNELNINSTVDVSRILITNTLGKIVGNITYTDNQTINTSNLSRGMYFVTFIGRDGNKVTQKLIKN